MVDGRTLTTASRQSKSLENSARLTRVTRPARRGLIARSICRASFLRRTRLSTRSAPDERKNKTPSLRMSETIPTIARAECSMRLSCQGQTFLVGIGHRGTRGTNYCDHNERRFVFRRYSDEGAADSGLAAG